MMQILFGSTNPTKLEEVRYVLRDSGVHIAGLKDFSDIRPVAETGSTFAENALLKARGYFEATGIPTIADDGGLMVDALDGLPGVHSHRWLGREATDQELAEAVLQRMAGVPREKRAARLGGVMVFYDGTHIIQKEQYTDGYIADRLMMPVPLGFPYRAILMIPQFGKVYGELTSEEHEAVNFRRKNLAVLQAEMLKYLAEK